MLAPRNVWLMKIGVHVSISGGIAKSIDRALERKCDTIQIFARTPRAWKGKDWDLDDVELFMKKRREASIKPVVIHTCYLINLATPREDLRRKSMECLIDDLRRADMADIEYVVTHPGSSSGMEGRTKRVRKCCVEALQKSDTDAQLLIENVSGSGNKVGSSLDELAEIVDGTDLGILIDTCHAFTAGIPIHEQPGAVLDEMEEKVGLERLMALHLNDSKGKFGSNIDHHEHIGEGEIGEEGFRRILSDKRIRSIPGILETPQRTKDDPSNDLINLARVRRILEEVNPE